MGGAGAWAERGFLAGQQQRCSGGIGSSRGGWVTALRRLRPRHRQEQEQQGRRRERASGGRWSLIACARAVPSGSPTNGSSSWSPSPTGTSIFSATTVHSECTDLSVRLLRDQATWRGASRVGMGRGGRGGRDEMRTGTGTGRQWRDGRGSVQAKVLVTQQGRARSSHSVARRTRTFLRLPRLEARMPPARKMASSSASSTVSSGAVSRCIWSPRYSVPS